MTTPTPESGLLPRSSSPPPAGLPRATRPAPAGRPTAQPSRRPVSVLRGGVVVEVREGAVARHTLQAAARLAAEEDVLLHLVATYALRDSCGHEAARVGAPSDIVHALTPKGDAEALVADAAERLAPFGVRTRHHTVRGPRGRALRTVAKATGAAVVVVDAQTPSAARRNLPCTVLEADRPLPRLSAVPTPPVLDHLKVDVAVRRGLLARLTGR